MKNEIEATFLSVDKEDIRKRLKAVGFELRIPEYMMKRKAFDIPPSLEGYKRWGRVRQEFDRVTMTIKEIRGTGINDTYETEKVIDDFDAGVQSFLAAGFPMKAFQESLREVWRRDEVETTIDTWPGLNPFVEIEGPSEDIVRAVSAELGFDFSKAVFGSVEIVYEKELGIPAQEILDMPEIVFANPPKKRTA